MRKPYIAPNCDYMTFTVDSAIASASCSYNGRDFYATFDDVNTCSVTVNNFKLFSGEGCEVKDVDSWQYCYYTGSLSIFGS